MSAMRGPQNDMNKVEAHLWESIRDGVYNFPEEDGQWELSYRAMQHGCHELAFFMFFSPYFS